MNISGTRVLILGLAREGASLARYFSTQGACVTVTDSADGHRLQRRVDELDGLPVTFALGGHFPDLVFETDAFFVSPGVPETNPVYVAARARGLPVQSMTTLFFDLCTGPIVGITGSSGKTTTTGLIGHILREAGRDVVVGGNIGDPMLDLLPKIGPDTTVVLELSSFQLDLLRRSPHIAVVTNISPNHLDRHGSMDAYIAAKRHVLEHQNARDYAVLHEPDPEIAEMAMSTPAQKRWFGISVARSGATVRDAQLSICERQGEALTFTPVIPVSDVPLIGSHNLENVLAAIATTGILGITPKQMACAIRSYKPAPHRLQIVAERDGITYVDDSIATSPARSVVALQSFRQPIVLIAGGRDKHLPWEDFACFVSKQVHALVLIGEAAALIEDSVRAAMGHNSQLKPGMIRRCGSLEAAVAEASRLARPGDVVLLSPGCTSYDMFSDYEERGAAFAHAVEALNAA